MRQFVVEINDAEEKALLTDMISIQDWIDNVIHNKARQCIDDIVEEVTDKRAKKVPVEEKLQIVGDAEVESAAERNARLEAEMGIGLRFNKIRISYYTGVVKIEIQKAATIV